MNVNGSFNSHGLLSCKLTWDVVNLKGSASMTAAELLVVNELANGVRQR